MRQRWWRLSRINVVEIYYDQGFTKWLACFNCCKYDCQTFFVFIYIMTLDTFVWKLFSFFSICFVLFYFVFYVVVFVYIFLNSIYLVIFVLVYVWVCVYVCVMYVSEFVWIEVRRLINYLIILSVLFYKSHIQS